MDIRVDTPSRDPRGFMRVFAAVFFLVVCFMGLGGCTANAYREAGTPFREQLSAEGPVGDCSRLLWAIDQQVEREGLRDPDAFRLPGYPYLAVDRFAAAWAAKTGRWNEGAVQAWLAYARELGDEGRSVELRNIGDALDLASLRGAGGRALPDNLAVQRELAECGDMLALADLARDGLLEQIRLSARVPDSYRTVHRVIGLYPLVSLPFAYGVRALHRATLDTFGQSLGGLRVRGELRRYIPGPSQGFGSVRGAGTREEVEALLAKYAPVWEVDTLGDEDAIGGIVWADDRVTTDPREPVVYQYLTRAWWNARPVLQLNYVAWFGARPKSGVFDLLGGHLDGITWRITLNSSGEPIAGDAVHNCGCYHMVFPGSGLTLLERSDQWEEPVLVPAPLPQFQPGAERLVLRIASGTHYLQRVYPTRSLGAGALYARVPYDRLRSISRSDGTRRSMFRDDGIVAGTERGERWLFWPMGVANAGAMRSRGHHAIAFVGRRHFDDPHLIERHFVGRSTSRE